MALRDSFSPLIDLVFPPRCPLCGEAIGMKAGLCATCWPELAIPAEPACDRCQRPFGDTMPQGGTCAPCLSDPPRHDGIAAATLYNDASRKLVLSLKHGGRIALAPWMGSLIANRLPMVGPGWLVVPVPLHRWRLWKRGYNQACELARVISRANGASLIVDGLVRGKPTPSLGGLGRLARRRVLAGAIAVRPSHVARLKGARVVLVDDVLTSGATSDACVSALKRAGAKQVVIACFSRVLDEALDTT